MPSNLKIDHLTYEKYISAESTLRDFSIEQQITENNNDKEKVPERSEYEIRGDMIIRDARETALGIMKQAEKTAVEIEEKSREKGYNEGFQKGQTEGFQWAIKENSEMFERELQEIKQLSEELILEKEGILEEYIDELKSIVIAVADKVIKTSVKSSSEIIKKMILSSVEKIEKTTWARIYISSELGDADLDFKGDHQFMQRLQQLSSNIKILVMEQTDPGTCIIELPDQVLDMSIGTQMENLKEIIYSSN